MKQNALMSLLLLVACFVVACGNSGDEVARTENASTTANVSNATERAPATRATPAFGADRDRGASSTLASPQASLEPPVSSAHGGMTTKARPLPSGAAGATADKPEIETAALDARIEQAEAKARAARASATERNAAAAAYFERGYVYYSGRNPRLYKYALRDFRRTLRYQPDNKEAQAIIAQIEGIYRGMGRPIPTDGLE